MKKIVVVGSTIIHNIVNATITNSLFQIIILWLLNHGMPTQSITQERKIDRIERMLPLMTRVKNRIAITVFVIVVSIALCYFLYGFLIYLYIYIYIYIYIYKVIL